MLGLSLSISFLHTRLFTYIYMYILAYNVHCYANDDKFLHSVFYSHMYNVI